MGLIRRVSEKGGDNNRIKWVAGGFVIGFLWGSVMWLITGMQGDAKVWIYLSLTMAMIGGGVAAIFGAMNARKKGERISPRLAPKGAKEEKATRKAAKNAAPGEGE